MTSSFPRSLLVLAILYTALNCVKPLVVDDTAYFLCAEQIAKAPLDPYRHWILWYDAPDAANEVLAPAVLPYYLAPAVWLFPQTPALWKLWLFPIALLFVWALHDLFRRFAPGLQVPMTWLTVLSPAFLPGFNLMLDVPAVALSLTALAVFLRALDGDRVTLAAFAGLIAGVAMQTKYTAGVALPVMLAAAVVWRKPRLWVPTVVLAAHVFIAWELVTALLYKQSHFLFALGDVPETRTLWASIDAKVRLILPLLGNLGGTASAVALVALAGMRVPGRWLVGAAGAVVGAWLVIAFVPLQVGSVRLDQFMFVVVGVTVTAVLAAAGVWLLKSDRGGTAVVWFLLAWLLLEVLAYYPLTLFPAVRRVMGVVLAASFLAAHLAARTCSTGPGRRKVRWVVGFGAALGFVVYGTDLLEAATEKAAAEHAAVVARDLAGPDRTVWYMGHWGFQFYGEAAGMKPVIGAFGSRDKYIEMPPASLLREGDVVVVPNDRVYRQDLELDPRKVEPVVAFAYQDLVPLRTVWAYYSGFGPASPKGGDPRLEVQIYRVKKDCVLSTPPRR